MSSKFGEGCVTVCELLLHRYDYVLVPASLLVQSFTYVSFSVCSWHATSGRCIDWSKFSPPCPLPKHKGVGILDIELHYTRCTKNMAFMRIINFL